MFLPTFNCNFKLYIYIYVDTIKGGRDTAAEVEAQLYSDNSIIGK